MDNLPKFSCIVSSARLPRLIWTFFMAKSPLKVGNLIPPGLGHCEALGADNTLPPPRFTEKAGVGEAYQCCNLSNKHIVGVDKECGWKSNSRKLILAMEINTNIVSSEEGLLCPNCIPHHTDHSR